ncbi:MAG: putative glycine dehydrogenase (decarboxylating) subunit 2 [Phycisphaerae bacterium]|nr:putative glycine dehydrogenase (decarboxylating) subunit 2 [Phycisphaerae bacterium]
MTQNHGVADVDVTIPLLFEEGSPGSCAVSLSKSDVPQQDVRKMLPAELVADDSPPLPEIAEMDLVRHFTRLAHRAFSVDANFYPLGSCTMKYNPRINERAAALPGFANLHPYQPVDQIQGLLELLYAVREFLQEISGLPEVCLQPAAGAHGEMTGLMLVNAYHRDRGEQRLNVLVPDSAHGTNPATCTVCSRTAITVKSRPDGKVDLDDLRKKVDRHTAALMITNPNTVGVFDEQIGDLAEILHEQGALLYMDGANMNAMLGIMRPGDFGVDVMHFNTHKTFSTPHGGGGPGSGPVAVAEKLRPFLPIPQVIKKTDATFELDHNRPKSIGKVRAFFGQVGVLVRCYTYIRSLGTEGLRNVSDKAVLSANYLAKRLEKAYHFPIPGPYAHEFILVPKFEETGVTEIDVAKRLIDHGIHPPTMSWPVHHCLMIEPTETESLRTLDYFADTMLKIAREARETPEVVKNAPHHTPISRADEVGAARKPNVRWLPG